MMAQQRIQVWCSQPAVLEASKQADWYPGHESGAVCKHTSQMEAWYSEN